MKEENPENTASHFILPIGDTSVEFYVLWLNFCDVRTLCTFSYFSSVGVIKWPLIGKIAALSAFNMISKYIIT